MEKKPSWWVSLLPFVALVGLLALVIIFQPELRRFLEKVGSNRLTKMFGGEFHSMHTEGAITQTVLACADLSKSRTGALIIFERDNQLSEPISTGTIVDAQVTAELLKNIFYVKAPLHDGAVIIKDGRIAAAGCMLPMSANMNLSKDLGMRHRAGIGANDEEIAAITMALYLYLDTQHDQESEVITFNTTDSHWGQKHFNFKQNPR